MKDRTIEPSEFVTLRRRTDPQGEADTSSLLVKPGHLQVVGVLPHGAEIQPNNLAEARRLIEWLEEWIRVEEYFEPE